MADPRIDAVDTEHDAGYRRLLQFQGVPLVMASSVLARLPNGMTSVLIVLLVNRSAGSFVLAGLAVAANSIGYAGVSPLFGKLADRGYTGQVLVMVGVLQPVTTGLFVAAVTQRWSVPLCVALAALTGATYPPIGAITRASWGRMLPGHLHRVAYGTEAMLTETIYIVGPLLAMLAVLVSGPGLGLVVGAGCVAIGSILLAFTPGLRSLGAASSSARAGAASMWTVGSAAVLAVSTGMGVAFGVLEVCIPAFASGFPRGEVLSAVLLAVWSSASVIGGVVYLRLKIGASAQTQLLVLVLGNALGFAVLGLAGAPVVLGILLFVGGLLMAPAATAEMSVVGVVATPGRTTETFTWLNTGAYIGGAAGSAAAGVLIETVGIRATMSLSAAFALIAVAAAAASVAVRHRTPAHHADKVNAEKGCTP